MPNPNFVSNRSFTYFFAATVAAMGLLIICFQWGAGSFGSSGPSSFPEQQVVRSPATVEHDNAPWCGAAFTVWIPAGKSGGRTDSWINVRIWKAPGESKMKFVFPDEAMKTGSATYYTELESPVALDWKTQPRQSVKGWIRFSQVSSDQPILGEFDFVTENAIPLKGQFEAQWLNMSLRKASQ